MNNPKFEDLPRYTYEDYLSWEGRWELIYGLAHAMSPSPSIEPNRLASMLPASLIGLWKVAANVERCYPLIGKLTKKP